MVEDQTQNVIRTKSETEFISDFPKVYVHNFFPYLNFRKYFKIQFYIIFTNYELGCVKK